MRVEIRRGDLEVDAKTQERVERRVHFAFSRFAPRVERVRVRLYDVNGPRGGVDKVCQVTATVTPWGGANVAEADPVLEAAIDRAVNRAGRAVARLVERRRARKNPSRFEDPFSRLPAAGGRP
jgi:hypothetical protein